LEKDPLAFRFRVVVVVVVVDEVVVVVAMTLVMAVFGAGVVCCI